MEIKEERGFEWTIRVKLQDEDRSKVENVHEEREKKKDWRQLPRQVVGTVHWLE